MLPHPPHVNTKLLSSARPSRSLSPRGAWLTPTFQPASSETYPFFLKTLPRGPARTPSASSSRLFQACVSLFGTKPHACSHSKHDTSSRTRPSARHSLPLFLPFSPCLSWVSQRPRAQWHCIPDRKTQALQTQLPCPMTCKSRFLSNCSGQPTKPTQASCSGCIDGVLSRLYESMQILGRKNPSVVLLPFFFSLLPSLRGNTERWALAVVILSCL